MDYRKEKSGRIKGPRGPRDLQSRQSSGNNQLVSELMGKIERLTMELAELKSNRSAGDKKYTDEEFNAELIKALDRELASLEGDSAKNLKDVRKDYEEKVRALVEDLEKEVALNKQLLEELTDVKQRLTSAEVKLASKEEVIEILKSQPVQAVVTVDGASLVQKETLPDKDVNAPSMDEVVIDPTESDSKMESHINVKSDSGGNQSDKLAKLKKLGIGGG